MASQCRRRTLRDIRQRGTPSLTRGLEEKASGGTPDVSRSRGRLCLKVHSGIASLAALAKRLPRPAWAVKGGGGKTIHAERQQPGDEIEQIPSTACPAARDGKRAKRPQESKSGCSSQRVSVLASATTGLLCPSVGRMAKSPFVHRLTGRQQMKEKEKTIYSPTRIGQTGGMTGLDGGTAWRKKRGPISDHTRPGVRIQGPRHRADAHFFNRGWGDQEAGVSKAGASWRKKKAALTLRDPKGPAE